jgi:hypothetical protein
MKFETKTVNSVKFYDLQKAIEEKFGQKVDVLWANEYCNGSFREVTVDGESEFEFIDDEDNVLAWLANPNDKLSYEYALHLLFKAGDIPAGNWIVDISW